MAAETSADDMLAALGGGFDFAPKTDEKTAKADDFKCLLCGCAEFTATPTDGQVVCSKCHAYAEYLPADATKPAAARRIVAAGGCDAERRGFQHSLDSGIDREESVSKRKTQIIDTYRKLNESYKIRCNRAMSAQLFQIAAEIYVANTVARSGHRCNNKEGILAAALVEAGAKMKEYISQKTIKDFFNSTSSNIISRGLDILNESGRRDKVTLSMLDSPEIMIASAVRTVFSPTTQFSEAVQRCAESVYHIAADNHVGEKSETRSQAFAAAYHAYVKAAEYAKLPATTFTQLEAFCDGLRIQKNTISSFRCELSENYDLFEATFDKLRAEIAPASAPSISAPSALAPSALAPSALV